MRYLGIDYGTRKVGLALSDEAGMMGFPHGIIMQSKTLVDEIVALIAKEKVGAVIMGESIDFGGGENAVASDARTLSDQIAERAKVPVFYEDERLTSAEARRQHDPSEKTREPKSIAPVDASAAALILTSFLSKHDNH